MNLIPLAGRFYTALLWKKKHLNSTLTCMILRAFYRETLNETSTKMTTLSEKLAPKSRAYKCRGIVEIIRVWNKLAIYIYNLKSFIFS